MLAALLLFLLFGRAPDYHPCPSFRDEVVPRYVPLAEYNAKRHAELNEWREGETIYFVATTTYRNGIAFVQVGTTTDQEAIEYNKRVRECKTARGEF